ncbi:hypothetical protein P7C71_g1161, partial [Lecanoromycetidae sp. Uapishka_2]
MPTPTIRRRTGGGLEDAASRLMDFDDLGSRLRDLTSMWVIDNAGELYTSRSAKVEDIWAPAWVRYINASLEDSVDDTAIKNVIEELRTEDIITIYLKMSDVLGGGTLDEELATATTPPNGKPATRPATYSKPVPDIAETLRNPVTYCF